MAERHDAHGYWLDEAPAADPPPVAIDRDVRADVLVVGGGYTGMWTAWQLRRLEPEIEVVVAEQGVCGEGPSGRNGGFCNGLWFSLPNMVERFGLERARDVALAAQDSVDAIGEFCREQEVDAWFRQAGYMQVSTGPAWDGAWEPAVRACAAAGRADACLPLSAESVGERCRSPVFRSGALYPHAATVQPARLARGLRRRLRELGVSVFERSPAGRVRRDGEDVRVAVGEHEVRARHVVLATGGRLAREARLRHRLTLTSSHMVITEPVPDLLAEIGWTQGECITDARAMVHYFRTTPDGRIAFGWGGGRIAFGAATRGRAEVDPWVIRRLEAHLLRFFPGLEGRRIERAWGGPIDVSPSHLPVFGRLSDRVSYAYGYTGHGVGPSHLAGTVLAAIALDRRDAVTRLALVEPPPVRVPPEPFRYVGGSLIRRAIVRREEALERGSEAGAITRFVASVPERIGIHVGR